MMALCASPPRAFAFCRKQEPPHDPHNGPVRSVQVYPIITGPCPSSGQQRGVPLNAIGRRPQFFFFFLHPVGYGDSDSWYYIGHGGGETAGRAEYSFNFNRRALCLTRPSAARNSYPIPARNGLSRIGSARRSR